MNRRDNTKVTKIGSAVIGGGNPVLIQSMTNTNTEDVKATVAQIHRLEKKGCEIIRCAVPTTEAADALQAIKEQIHIPIVADIHFDHKLALRAIANGADKIRINPGNIGGKEKVKEVTDAAKEKNIPIRVGVNGGSLERDILEKYKGVTAEGLVESAMKEVGIIEDMGYDNLVVSIKASDVLVSFDAYRLISEKCSYPGDIPEKLKQICVLRSVIDHGKMASLLPAEIRNLRVGRKSVSGRVIKSICVIFEQIEFVRERLGENNVLVGILLNRIVCSFFRGQNSVRSGLFPRRHVILGGCIGCCHRHAGC